MNFNRVIIFDVWSKDHGKISIHDLLPKQFTEIQQAANFVGVSGRRADHIVADEFGHLFIVDSCGTAHDVDPSLFVAISPESTVGNPMRTEDQKASAPVQRLVGRCECNDGDEACGKPTTASAWIDGVKIRVCKTHAAEGWVKGYTVISDRAPNAKLRDAAQ